VAARSFDPSSRGRLTDRDLDRFSDTTLFHRIARAVCHAGCLPRKELFEAWEMGRRVRRLFRGGRVVDLAGGHGLLAQVMLLLDDSSPDAIVADKTLPASAAAVREALAADWPRLVGRVSFLRQSLEAVEIAATDVVVSNHPCGRLTDIVLERAVGVRARVGVMPCCHDVGRSDTRHLRGWVDGALAVDIVRAQGLKQHGYRVWTQTIPDAITPENRLLLGAPL